MSLLACRDVRRGSPFVRRAKPLGQWRCALSPNAYRHLRNLDVAAFLARQRPSMPQPQFAQGAIRPPTDFGLQQHLAALEQAVPAAGQHRRAFRELGSEYVYARNIDGWEFREIAGAWVALIRFGLAVETMFGLTREVAILYTTHKDLQIRTFNQVPKVLASLPRDVTPGVVLISSPDRRQDQKLDDWSDLRLTAIPVPHEMPATTDPWRAILRTLEQRLFQRDLYAETSPVSGAGFFGRQILLQSLMDDVQSRRVPGVFGLRKTGKTSLLKRLGHLLSESEDPRYIFVLRDLESLPSLPREVIHPLLLELHSDILNQLREKGLRTRGLAELDDPGDLLAFKRALQTLLRKADPRFELVVALDEVEYLCPPDRMDVETPETQEIPQFFGVLRSLLQETDHFTFVFAGLASATIEAGTLFGRHNPLFSWAKPYYVPPFMPEEATQLLRELGRRMGVRWQVTAEDEVYVQTGGHPYLLRDLASAVTRSLPLNAAQRQVTRGAVHRRLPEWKRTVAGNISEILAHVERYYPSERLLLDYLLEDEETFAELAKADPLHLHHLLSLGLVLEPRPGVFKPSSLVGVAPE